MRVISFVNMKGGVGKTTLAVNFADALSRRLKNRVLLVDLDPQFNATQSLYGGEEYLNLRKGGADTIYDVFANPAPIISAVKGAQEIPSKKLQDIEPTAISGNLHVLLGNLEIYRIEMGGGRERNFASKHFLGTMRKNTTTLS